MRALAQAPQGRAHFIEQKKLAALTTPLTSEGELLYRKPAHLEKITTAPTPEKLVVDGDRLVISDAGNGAPRVLELSDQPQVAALIDTIRAAVTGDAATLQRLYTVDATGDRTDWRIVMRPRDPALGRLVQEVDLTGAAQLRTLASLAPNGDTDTLTITPPA